LKTSCGSPCYAAPEMIIGKYYSGLAVDIWSSGITLFAMVCGYLPFEDKNNDVLYDKIISCKLSFPGFVSERSKDLIKRILHVNPNKRATLDEIKAHVFCKQSENLLHKIPHVNSLEYRQIKEDIMEKMIQMGHDKEVVETNLENKKHNNITTTFELFVKKYIKSEIFKKSIGPLTCVTHLNSLHLNTGNNNSTNVSNVGNIANVNTGNNIYAKNKNFNFNFGHDKSKKDEGKDININIINYSKKIGNININISNPTTYIHQIIPPSGDKSPNKIKSNNSPISSKNSPIKSPLKSPIKVLLKEPDLIRLSPSPLRKLKHEQDNERITLGSPNKGVNTSYKNEYLDTLGVEKDQFDNKYFNTINTEGNVNIESYKKKPVCMSLDLRGSNMVSLLTSNREELKLVSPKKRLKVDSIDNMDSINNMNDMYKVVKQKNKSSSISDKPNDKNIGSVNSNANNNNVNKNNTSIHTKNTSISKVKDNKDLFKTSVIKPLKTINNNTVKATTSNTDTTTTSKIGYHKKDAKSIGYEMNTTKVIILYHFINIIIII